MCVPQTGKARQGQWMQDSQGQINYENNKAFRLTLAERLICCKWTQFEPRANSVLYFPLPMFYGHIRRSRTCYLFFWIRLWINRLNPYVQLVARDKSIPQLQWMRQVMFDLEYNLTSVCWATLQLCTFSCYYIQQKTQTFNLTPKCTAAMCNSSIHNTSKHSHTVRESVHFENLEEHLPSLMQARAIDVACH